MNKKAILLCVLLFCFTIAQTQNITHNWSTSAGYFNGPSKTVDGVVDNSDNVYVLGTFEGQQITFGSTTLNNSGQIDIFLVKYDYNGNVIWAKSFGNIGNDTPTAMEIDQNGSLLITGHFSSQNLTFGSTTLQTNGAKDIFIVKIDNSGSVLWAKSAGGNLDDISNGVAVHENNIYITGNFTSNTLSFGTKTVSKSAALADIFIASYDDLGNDIWAINSNSNIANKSSRTNDIIVDNQNNIVIIGSLDANYAPRSYINFGNDTIFNNSPYSSERVVFIAKFQSNGNFIMSKSDSLNTEALSISVDTHNNYYLSLLKAQYIFIGTTSYYSSLIKLSSNLDQKWKKEFNSGTNRCTDIVVDEDKVYATGYCSSGVINFETDTISASSFNDGYANIFLVSYDTSGTENWVENYEGYITDKSSRVIPYSNRNLCLIGYYESANLLFDNNLLTNTNDEGAYESHFGDPLYWRYSNVFITQMNNISVGINELEKNKSTIYPNPSSGLFSISSNENIHYLEILDGIGKVIMKKENINRKTTTINLYPAAKGVYFIKKTNSNGASSLNKIIIY